MKKNTLSFLRISLALLLSFLMLLGTVACTGSGSGDTTTAAEADSTEPAETSDDTPVVPPEPEELKLSSITIDGVELTLEDGKKDYEVLIPAGHPRIPRIAAAGNDAASLEVIQATIPVAAAEGTAKVIVTFEDKTSTYNVKFTKSKDAGFALQYDDRYAYTPAYTLGTGETFTYASADASKVAVSANGTIRALAVTSDPVDVTVSVGGEVKETVSVKVDPAQICFFLIVGQSNAAGTYDDSNSNKSQSDMPDMGISYCVDVSKGPSVYDLNAGRAGFAPALGKEWYNLTGEKSLMIQGAVGGSPIENWQKRAGNYENTLSMYITMTKKYTNDPKFEIIRTGAFWCQGETAQANEWTGSGWKSSGNIRIQTSAEYMNLFMKMYDNFVKEMKIDFFSIALVRALKSVTSAQNYKEGYMTDLVAPRAAQYAANGLGDDHLFIASRICDIARALSAPDKTSEGYGYMGSNNLHYSQTGYNAQGHELAKNTYAAICGTVDRTPTELEVIDSNGRTRLEDKSVIEVVKGKTHQIASIVLPIYTNQSGITYEITEGGEYATVDQFGAISFIPTAPIDATATLTVTSESGLTKTFTLKHVVTATPVATSAETEPPAEPIIDADLTLHWDFNDLNEENGKSNLTLSALSPTTDNYTLQDGKIVLPVRTVDFDLATPFKLAQNFNWSIEWKGWTTVSSALFGQQKSNQNFIYFAITTPSWGNPFRMVSNEGTAAMIKLSDDYVAKAGEMNVWKIDYQANTKTMTLYFMGSDGTANEVVGTYTWEGEFTFTITNMFGRYGSSSTVVNWRGEMDYITVTAHTVG